MGIAAPQNKAIGDSPAGQEVGSPPGASRRTCVIPSDQDGVPNDGPSPPGKSAYRHLGCVSTRRTRTHVRFSATVPWMNRLRGGHAVCPAESLR
jgi:hypothetical protein